ncbi:hypothetical protein CCP4SC76_320002 [Gammaproteobacteria bacterium]
MDRSVLQPTRERLDHTKLVQDNNCPKGQASFKRPGGRVYTLGSAFTLSLSKGWTCSDGGLRQAQGERY